MTVANITAGFKVTGVYPVNRNAFSVPGDDCECLPKQMGLAFIPLYSPASKRAVSQGMAEDSRHAVKQRLAEEFTT